jgi:hypothetical protein
VVDIVVVCLAHDNPFWQLMLVVEVRLLALILGWYVTIGPV